MSPDATPPSARALRLAPERREVALILGVVLLLNVPGGFLQLANLRWGLLVTQVFFIAAPVLLAIRFFYLDGRAILLLRWPRASDLAGALLGTAGLNHLLNYALFWQDRSFPLPGLWRELFEDLATYHGPGDFLLLLLIVAVVPAVCEEILFRGFVHSGLVREFESAPKAILAGAFVFAGFHLNPWRFSVLLVIGLFLGYLVHRTGSLLPAMLAHAFNNAMSLGLAGLGETAQAGLLHSPWAHGASAACLVFAVLLRRRAAPLGPRGRVL
ncbi:MAG: CPBP family intramembrane metalloprotease [Acidobacteria bacterium]|nr:CPBP family intramembrane metalloprotease [Acidobacteriota bacterium]